MAAQEVEMQRLSAQQARFVDAYLGHFNATAAAREAGYSEPHSSSGWRVLQSEGVQAEIQRRLDAAGDGNLQPPEIVARLAQQARGAHAAYLRADGSLDLDAVLKDGQGHLLKSLKVGKDGELEVTFYSSQRALEILARVHGLFVERRELTINVPDADDLRREISEAMDRVAAVGGHG
jgi:phage terminase small subunit